MTQSNRYALIMAGGLRHTILASIPKTNPKQLLPFGSGGQSLLQETIKRIAPIIPAERVLIVTGKHLLEAIHTQLPDIPKNNILAEPTGRNTAPCVGWGASHAFRRDKNAVLAVLPSDQHIANEKAYREKLDLALNHAETGELVTIGLRPAYPETGFGYIETADEKAPGVNEVRRFVEKPDLQTAKQYIKAGNFYWNSGMFFFKASVLLEEVKKHLPALSETLAAFDAAAKEGKEDEVVEALYPEAQNISIDNGIMEKAEHIACIPSEFGWSDVGSWRSAWQLGEKDANQNVNHTQSILHDVKGCYMRAEPGKIIAAVGLEDMVIVDTADALLVMPKNRAQDVRQIVRQLKEQNRQEVLE